MIRVFGKGSSSIIVEVVLCQPSSCISSDQIRGIQTPDTAILSKRAPL